MDCIVEQLISSQFMLFKNVPEGLCLTNAEYLSSAFWACALYRRAAVFECNRFWILDVYLCSTFYAVSLHWDSFLCYFAGRVAEKWLSVKRVIDE